MASSDISRRGTPRRRRPWLWVLVTLAVLLALYAGAQAAVGLKDIPRGTSVAGVDVGGKTIEEAAGLIETRSPTLRRSVDARIGDQLFPLDPRTVGLGIDGEASARKAAGRPWTPWAIVATLAGTRELEAIPSVDDATLTTAITDLGSSVESPFQEGDVVYEGMTPVAVAPTPGRQLDVPASVSAVRDAFLAGSTDPVDLPLTEAIPTISAEEVDRVLTTVAEAAVAGPVTLKTGDKKLIVPAAAIAETLDFVPNGPSLEPQIDGAALLETMDRAVSQVLVKPKNAGFELSGGRPVVVPAVLGTRVTADGLATSVEALLASPPPREGALVTKQVEPKLTTSEARKLGVVEKVGEFTTQHPCCLPRVTNIHRMADIVSGTLILPGSEFDLNGIVGERDRARGFVEAPMIERGLFTDSVGGGVSQFATTMFNAAFYGGFPIPEWKAHSYYISRYPPGREATVSFPKPDLRWVNDSKYGALVTASYTGTSITVTIWSTKRFEVTDVSSGAYRPTTPNPPIVYNERPDCSPASGAGGFDIDVWRVFSRGGKEIKREKFSTRYIPEPVIICAPEPKPTPTVSPSPTKTGDPKPKPTTSPTPKPAVSGPKPGTAQ